MIDPVLHREAELLVELMRTHANSAAANDVIAWACEQAATTIERLVRALEAKP